MEKYSKEFDKECSYRIKGIAILLMCTHHLFRTQALWDGTIISFWPFSEQLITNIASISKICVSIFVFISGYGLTLGLQKKEPLNLDKYYIGKYLGLIARFAVVFIPILIMAQLINGRVKSFYFAESVIRGTLYLVIDCLGLSNLFGLQSFYGAYWYFSAAIVFIFITPILLSVLKKYGCIVCFGIIIILPRILGIGYIEGNAIYPFVFSLALGILFAEKNIINIIMQYFSSKDTIMERILRYFLVTIALCILYKVYLYIPINIFWEINWGIVPAILIIICCITIVNIPIISTVLYFLGIHSMNIFIIHVFIIANFKDKIYSLNNFMLSILALVAGSLIISIVAEYIKRGLKFNERLNKIISKLSI